jgi:hypothetical protein
LIDIECGTNGKPHYIQGLNENEQQAGRILAKLERTAGAGNYHFQLNSEDDNEDFDEYFDDNYDEFEGYSFEERKELFMSLLSRREKLSEKESDKLIDLTGFVMNEIVDEDETDNYLEILENELDVTILPMEELPFEIWGVEPGTLLVTKEMEELFFDCYQAIMSQQKKADDKLNKLKQMVGEIPATGFLELMIVQTQISEDTNGMEDEYLPLVKKLYDQFPDYPLFEILYITCIGNSELKRFIAGPRLKYFFNDRIILHELEFLNYILLLLTDFSLKRDVNKLWAMELYIFESALADSLEEPIIEAIKLLKLQAVAEYFMEIKK